MKDQHTNKDCPWVIQGGAKVYAKVLKAQREGKVKAIFTKIFSLLILLILQKYFSKSYPNFAFYDMYIIIKGVLNIVCVIIQLYDWKKLHSLVKFLGVAFYFKVFNYRANLLIV